VKKNAHYVEHQSALVKRRTAYDVLGRCAGGWLAPYWCQALKTFYTRDGGQNIQILKGITSRPLTSTYLTLIVITIGPNVTGKKIDNSQLDDEGDLESNNKKFKELGVQAVEDLAGEENLAPYVGHIVTLDSTQLRAFVGAGEATHLIAVKDGVYIDPRHREYDCISVDVGWLGYGREVYNLAMRANTAGTFMKNNFNIQNNCSFVCGSATDCLLWLRTSTKIFKGNNMNDKLFSCMHLMKPFDL